MCIVRSIKRFLLLTRHPSTTHQPIHTMKTLLTCIVFVCTATWLHAQTAANPTGYTGNVTLQTFEEELGNYTAAQFNSLAGTYLVNFDDTSEFTAATTVTSVLYDSPTSGFNYRANFGLLAGGFGRIIETGASFVSSPDQSSVWGNGGGATIEFPDIAWGASNDNQDIYGVGFTIARLQAPMDVSFYSDLAGNTQVGSTISLSANSSGSGYSFVGYAGTDQIRRVELATATNTFGIDDVIVAVSPIPEPSTLIMLLLGAFVIGPMAYFRKKK